MKRQYVAVLFLLSKILAPYDHFALGLHLLLERAELFGSVLLGLLWFGLQSVNGQHSCYSLMNVVYNDVP